MQFPPTLALCLFKGTSDYLPFYLFPTRHSSDLPPPSRRRGACAPCAPAPASAPRQIGRAPSELQSPMYLVCRLLLEKKKLTQIIHALSNMQIITQSHNKIVKHYMKYVLNEL